MKPRSSLYVGEVVHRRIRPVRHDLRYRVYNLFLDVDELHNIHERIRCLSYNRFNLFSLRDRDHGPGDGTPIAEHVWQVARQSATAGPVQRIFMFTYPRVMGYVFNPLTVYYCFDAADQLCLMIYEVNNTFGQRHSYVIPVSGDRLHACRKSFYVSPFNRVEGTYRFSAAPPDESLKLSIILSTPEGVCLSAWFSGQQVALTDGNLLRSFISLPLQPFKVIGGIHAEAAKLWLKGLRVQPRPSPPAQDVSFTIPETQDNDRASLRHP
ncbi:MAG: DUF1365 domain-containing protein [Alphaproteobacteria bacterium]|nr:DUF1365 domain-containing protein [Alphaproteobacteria bacterium]